MKDALLHHCNEQKRRPEEEVKCIGCESLMCTLDWLSKVHRDSLEATMILSKVNFAMSVVSCHGLCRVFLLFTSQFFFPSSLFPSSQVTTCNQLSLLSLRLWKASLRSMVHVPIRCAILVPQCQFIRILFNNLNLSSLLFAMDHPGTLYFHDPRMEKEPTCVKLCRLDIHMLSARVEPLELATEWIV